ncbi:MAG: hypothetical protein II477_01835 [Lachnospiraceae bacterium]|nr:hypothetical protein [Lachnospiraceae bacterium]MBQ2099794.1 hypothetical protein [Lachnospiraceae bacterium]MBQ3905369.1 hypothetical protein [Lachnospiraceae bacterium]MCR4597430.1 hypothetical protein [Acetatifactor sp.]
MAEKKEVFWHLPGLCYFRLLNQILINTMKDYPDKFRDGYKIGSVYGTIPGAIWNGGRAVFGISNKADIERVIHTYNQYGIPARFTWSNSLLEEKHCYDTYCNMIMKLADNGLNQAIVNRPCLEEYIRKNYPSYKLISSTTKRMTDPKELSEEVLKDYFLVVLDYDLNRNEEVIKSLEPVAGKIEILVNEICFPGCPKRAEHYRDESRSQLEFDNRTEFQCPNNSRDRRTFEECMKRPAFMSTEEVDRYIERGFNNFKIVGRGLPQQFVLDSYLYFLVKDEARDFVRKHIVGTLESLQAQQRAAMRR